MSSNLLLYSGTGRDLGLPLSLERDIKKTQISLTVEPGSPLFLYGVKPVIDELMKMVTLEDIDDPMLPFSRREQFSGEKWSEMVAVSGDNLPIDIYMAEEGEILTEKKTVLTIETTDERFPWLAFHVAAALEPHIRKVSSMTQQIMALRTAIRQATIKYSDREATDLCKLFLLPNTSGMTLGDMQLYSAIFKTISPLESSPISVKHIVDNYHPETLHPSAVISADLDSGIGTEISERLGLLLSHTRDRHINLYVKEKHDTELFDELLHFNNMLQERNAPLVICLEDGDLIKRSKHWMKNLGELVGMEQNSMGLEHPDKQFGLGIKIEKPSDITRISKEMAAAGYTTDGYSFMIEMGAVYKVAKTNFEKTLSFKTEDWDDKYIEAALPPAYLSSMPIDVDPHMNIGIRILNYIESKYPHDFKPEDKTMPGRFSGWWARSVVMGESNK